MKKGLFTEEELKYLNSLNVILRADPLRLTYSQEFKKDFIARLKAGERPKAIFESVGLYVSLIGYKRIERASAHWQEADAKDALCLTHDKIPTRDDIRAHERRRASIRVAATRASKQRAIAEMEVKMVKAKHKAKNANKKLIDSLRAENESLKAQVKALKALGTLSRRTQRAKYQTTKTERFELISQLRMENPKLNVKAVCEALEVSRSGYYDYLNASEMRQKHEKEDLATYDQIKQAYDYKGLKKGSREIKHLLKRKDDICMNRKKIQRIMRKFGLVYKRRRKNPYAGLHSDGTSKVAPNIVKRKFRKGTPLTILSTDITYLPGKNGFSYLSAMIDCETSQIVAYKLSDSMFEQFVLDTCNQLKALNLTNKTIICSDQGVHYTSHLYYEKLQELGVTQSMSRKACCLDNAPIESFWGKLKFQIGSTKHMSHKEIEEAVDEYIHYYNTERAQKRLGWLTPNEYAKQLVA